MPLRSRRARGIALLVAVVALVAVAIGASPSTSAAPVGWHEGRHTHRVIVTVQNGATAKVDALVEVAAQVGPGNLLPDTVRVTEVTNANPTTSTVVEADVPVQVDNPDGSATIDGDETVVFLVDGTFTGNDTRFFHVYFGNDRGQSPGFIDSAAAAAKRPVTVTFLQPTDGDNPYDIGVYRIETRAGTWYFEPNGGGFARLVDANGNDWIEWDPDIDDEGGEFRGIPKARLDTTQYGNDEGPFSPGSNDTLSTLTDAGPVRVTITAQSRSFATTELDGLWEAVYEVGPRSMVFRMTDAPNGVPWRALYQGEPGGTLNDADQVILSGQNGNNPTQLNATNFSGASLGSPEWAAFLDGGTTRSLVVAASPNPELDISTTRTTEDGSTTIFGFGRAISAQTSHELLGVGDEFTYGLVDSKNPGTLATRSEDLRDGPIDGSDGSTVTPATIEANSDVDTPGENPISTTTTAVTTPDTVPPPPLSGYRLLDQRGDVYVFGEATFLGEARGDDALPGTPVDIESTPSNRGYWILDDQGNVREFGDAPAISFTVPALDPGETVATMSSTPSGGGFWIFTTKGRVITAGDAGDFNDLFGTTDANGNVIAEILNGPIVDSVATPSGNGYWMVASDGGVFTFGDAAFFGSMGGTMLNQPVNGLVPDPDNVGYWLVAGDGGVFAFDADFRGSVPGVLPDGVSLNAPVVGMVSYGNGYLMVGSDGGVFNFSDLPFDGSLGDDPPTVPVVAITA